MFLLIAIISGTYQGILNLKTLRNISCTFCGQLIKTTILKNHERNHTKCQFSTKRSDPLHLTFVQFFWVELLLMGQRTACLVTLIYFLEKWALWNTLLSHCPPQTILGKQGALQKFFGKILGMNFCSSNALLKLKNNALFVEPFL